MEEYKNTPEESKNTVNEPAAVYERIQKVKNPHIRYDENGLPTGHTLAEFSEKLLDKLSEAYGVDFRKL